MSGIGSDQLEAPALHEEPLIQGEGTPESAWAACPTLQVVPALALDDLLPATARLVVVAPHPDDEVLGCGGLLAAHAARGGRVLVLASTDGEASHPDDPAWPPAQLAAERRRESLTGLARLAPARAPTTESSAPATATATAATQCQRQSLGFPDGGVAAVADNLQAQLQQWLRPDDVVVTTWLHDGHPDHDATGTATLRACAAAGCRLLQMPVWMWHWAPCPGADGAEPASATPTIPWQRLRAFDLDDAAWNRKQHALSAHATQLAPRAHGEGPVLGQHIVQRARRRREYFFL